MASQVEGAAQAVAEQGRQIQDNVQVVANNFRTAFEKSMRDQPHDLGDGRWHRIRPRRDLEIVMPALPGFLRSAPPTRRPGL